MTELAIKIRIEHLKNLVRDMQEELLRQRRENKSLQEVIERIKTIECSLRSGVQPSKRDPSLTCLVIQVKDLELINAKLLRDLTRIKRKLEKHRKEGGETSQSCATKRAKPDDDLEGPSTSKSSRGSVVKRQ